MILLFLGLAIVLTTSPLLLVASCKGRGDDGGGDDTALSNTSNAGEIVGSISITDSGELWLSVLIDDFSILAQLEIVECESECTGYRLSIAAVNLQSETKNTMSPQNRAKATGESHVVEFKNPQEASIRIIQLLDRMGVVISSESLKSIPHAITCGWKRPDESKQIVNRVLEGNSGS